MLRGRFGRRAENGRPARGPLPPDVVLAVDDLRVEYRAERGWVRAVRGVSFDLRRGETLAFIGESGSGKSTLALALVRLLVRSASVRSGTVLYQRDGRSYDVLRLQPAQLQRFRWQECALVFQAALNALNPVLRVGDQFLDVARAHGRRDKRAVKARSLQLLSLVQLDAERVFRSYPHELSGGMRQRVLLAMGLLLDPQLIILDEPTTALDILTQRTIIDLLRRLKEELGFAVILVSHDLSLAAELADRVATVYAGRIVEFAPVRDLFYRPHHPYTLGLLSAVPTISGGFRPLESVKGSPPDLIDLPAGCTFHPRCPYARPDCTTAEPELVAVDGTNGTVQPEGAGPAGTTPNGAASASPPASPPASPAGPGGHLAACFRSDQVAAAWQARAAAAAVAEVAEAESAPEPAGSA